MLQTHTHTTPLRWTRADMLAIGLLTLVAGIVRFVRLTVPDHGIGDEGFYADDACWYVFGVEEMCGVEAETNLEHPPLGKWLIAAGIRVFGHTVLGHRILPAVLGTLCVPLLFVLARRLLRSTLGASMAATLLSVDFLQFVLSRTAMLDTFVLFFTLLAFLFVARDRDAGEGARPWWRYAAGAAAGAAAASKWSGLTVVLAVAFIGIAWDVLGRRAARERHPFFDALRRHATQWAIAYALIPIGIYALTFVGRIHGDLLALPWSESSWWNALWDRQVTTFRFHAELIWTHRFSSDPWEWPLARRAFPMADREVAGHSLMSIATGNPILWTLGFVAIGYVALRWLRAPRLRSPEGVILTGALFTYLPWVIYFYAPWLFFTWGRVATFVFYLLPTLPFLYLALAYAGGRLSRARVGRWAVAAMLGFAVAAFAFYYPLMAYVGLSHDQLQTRVFLFDDCDVPDRGSIVFPRRTTIDGHTSYEAATIPSSHAFPPDGWCWLNTPQGVPAEEDV